MIKFNISKLAVAVLVATFTSLFASAPCAQVESDEVNAEPDFIVGTEMTPPFSMGTESAWEGLSALLWEKIAEDIDQEYTVRNSGSLSSLISEVSSGDVDVAVASLTITSEREESLDFTHSFYATGISIATKDGGVPFSRRIIEFVKNFPASTLLKGILILCSSLFFIGSIFVFIEGDKHSLLKNMSIGKQLFHGWYWAAVTNTTTGYGVYAPESTLGKIYGVFWMYLSMLVTGSLIATLAYAGFNVAKTSSIEDLSDLDGYRVATVEGSTSSLFLEEEGVPHDSCFSIRLCLEMLDSNSVDAVVYDRPVLQYYVNENFENISVLDPVYDEQSYGFALPSGSPYVEQINRSLLREIGEDWWEEAQIELLGGEQ